MWTATSYLMAHHLVQTFKFIFNITCALGCGLETMIHSFLYITSPLNAVECATSSFL
jgi:hypothetical protein